MDDGDEIPAATCHEKNKLPRTSEERHQGARQWLNDTGDEETREHEDIGLVDDDQDVKNISDHLNIKNYRMKERYDDYRLFPRWSGGHEVPDIGSQLYVGSSSQEETRH